MARKPNYPFERMERERQKAAKTAAKAAAKLEQRQRQDLYRRSKVFDRAALVRLVRLFERARAVGHAVRHAGDSRDVLVVVGAGLSTIEPAARSRAGSRGRSRR